MQLRRQKFDIFCATFLSIVKQDVLLCYCKFCPSFSPDGFGYVISDRWISFPNPHSDLFDYRVRVGNNSDFNIISGKRVKLFPKVVLCAESS